MFDPNEMLSPNFRAREFVVSQTAARKGLRNIPGPRELQNLRRLASLLELIRVPFGPLYVSSGYRSEEVNKAVGGAKTSLHRMGCAADVEPRRPGVSLREIAAWTYQNAHVLDLEEVILEYEPDGWLHVAVPEQPGTGAMQFLEKRHGWKKPRVWRP